MNGNDLSRRHFMQLTGSLTGVSALRSGIPGLALLMQAACSARDAGAAFEVLTADEARELDAIVARIIPTTNTPGAREAGVIWFIDKAMGDFMADDLDFLRSGLAEFEAPVTAAFAGAERYSDLSEAEQDRHLATQDETPFFGFLHLLTMMGMFGMPSYGGNKDYVGWTLLGIDPHQHAFQPPFGYYDAKHREEHGHGD
ncbi:MAG: gluconate 2-dehydrogenase subunit 3 family protein [Woeseia sp.]|nr:gluconate 2-dehydrogenase subunit 3 family protein [Woeseia sp.]MBT8096460.1 gluconate 2-dehydrogenase subunit 3 family protein [Woeseia sp.]NNE62103.1 gluconate 2-dehydrogenase subunit 3 family protein [Woeseia sp.]NNL55307.1 gluconate 2-dehydrogenase subunit 3 family protein [Woeseia sp.]